MVLLVALLLVGSGECSHGDPAADSLAALRSRSHVREDAEKGASFTVHARAGEHRQEAQEGELY